MNDSLTLLILVVATAAAFDFTNGFHDTANAMANFAGAFISIKVAATITDGIVNALADALGGATGAIVLGAVAAIGALTLFSATQRHGAVRASDV